MDTYHSTSLNNPSGHFTQVASTLLTIRQLRAIFPGRRPSDGPYPGPETRHAHLHRGARPRGQHLPAAADLLRSLRQEALPAARAAPGEAVAPDRGLLGGARARQARRLRAD